LFYQQASDMNTNTFFEPGFFFLEKEIRQVWESLEKPEGLRRFVVQISKLWLMKQKNSVNLKQTPNR
jgi:hypothetical protein